MCVDNKYAREKIEHNYAFIEKNVKKVDAILSIVTILLLCSISLVSGLALNSSLKVSILIVTLSFYLGIFTCFLIGVLFFLKYFTILTIKKIEHMTDDDDEEMDNRIHVDVVVDSFIAIRAHIITLLITAIIVFGLISNIMERVEEKESRGHAVEVEPPLHVWI